VKLFGNWFKKAAPAITSSVFIDSLIGNLPQNIRAYAVEGYSQNPIAFACASIIATAAASVKLEVHRWDAEGKKVVETKHQVLDLLERPNKMQTWEEFAIEMVSWHRIAGEAFILRLPANGQPKELYVLNPANMDVKGGSNGNIPEKFVYTVNNEKREYRVNQFSGECQILHIKTNNPNDPWRGLSPLSASARAVDIHNAGAKWNSSLLNNSARPSGVLEIAGTVDPSTAERLRKWFKDAWQGAGNAGGLPLLTGGAKFTALSHNPKDMDFQNSMSAAAKDIGLVYGVPLPLLTMEASTFSNMDAAQERLWTETVLPLLDLLIKKLSGFLVTQFGETNMRLAYNADSVPALEAKRERMFKRMKEAVGGGLLTPNEARVEMGFDEIDGGEELLVPGNLRPANSGMQSQGGALAKAMKDAGFTASEIAEALEPELKKAA
jgi:HK97 family phage portal protein